MSFPIYRKLSNGKSFYQIESDKVFTEVQLLGTKVFKHRIEAKKYPELLRIQDMIELKFDFLTSDETEFYSMVNR